MSSFLKTRFIVLLLAALPLVVSAQNSISRDEINRLLTVKIRSIELLARNPVFVTAVRDQNADNMSLSTIRQLDAQWQSDGGSTLKRRLQQNQAGRLLRRYVKENNTFTEAFLTDNQGANVAAYPPTSDYWQGDEDKCTLSFNQGDGQTHVGPIEEDASTQRTLVQISAPVYDQGETIGVLIVGIDITYLDSRRNSR